MANPLSDIPDIIHERPPLFDVPEKQQSTHEKTPSDTLPQHAHDYFTDNGTENPPQHGINLSAIVSSAVGLLTLFVVMSIAPSIGHAIESAQPTLSEPWSQSQSVLDPTTPDILFVAPIVILGIFMVAAAVMMVMNDV